MSAKVASWSDMADAVRWWVEHAGEAFPSHAAADKALLEGQPAPIPMLLTCPMCGARHVDAGEFATKPHHTHACQSCGMTWRPAIVATIGVQFLPGFKDAPTGDAAKERG